MDKTLRNKVFDLAFSLLTNPVINDNTRLFRCLDKIKESKPGTIVLCKDVKEFGKKLIVLLPPNSIDYVKPKTLPIFTFGALTTPAKFDIQPFYWNERRS